MPAANIAALRGGALLSYVRLEAPHSFTTDLVTARGQLAALLATTRCRR